MSENLPADIGPYETEQQAADTCRSIYAQAPNLGYQKAYNRGRLTEACESAGVELGAYDLRVIEWLSRWEPEVVAAVAGLIARAGGAR